VKLRLHNYWRSSASQRVRIALGWKALPWEYVPVHLTRDGGEQHHPAYRALNPMGQLPALEVLEDDGGIKVITQSMAIIEYLDERWPAEALLPADPYLRARARGLAELVNSGIQPLQNLTTTRKVKELGGDDAVWVGGFIADGLRAFETIATASAGRYCVGDAVSIADVFLIPQLFGARRFGVDLEPMPLLRRIEAACNELPAFVAAEPNRQPDAQIAQT
jgi:maleylpyruvate isomerase